MLSLGMSSCQRVRSWGTVTSQVVQPCCEGTFGFHSDWRGFKQAVRHHFLSDVEGGSSRETQPEQIVQHYKNVMPSLCSAMLREFCSKPMSPLHGGRWLRIRGPNGLRTRMISDSDTVLERDNNIQTWFVLLIRIRLVLKECRYDVRDDFVTWEFWPKAKHDRPWITAQARHHRLRLRTYPPIALRIPCAAIE